MIEVNIPGRGVYHFTHVFFDFNGTLAVDGIVTEKTRMLLGKLAESAELILLTADTNQTARKQCEDLPIEVHVLQQTDQKKQKAEIVKATCGREKIVVGNGALDEEMLGAADLAICVMGIEGCAVSSLLKSDILVRDPESAVELLLFPNRLVSTWRS